MSQSSLSKDEDFINFVNSHQPKVRKITLDDPWRWLAFGWKDIKKAPYLSLPYGLIFVMVTYLGIWAIFDTDMFFMFPLLAAGFFLSAPILGIGLYGISRSLERNEKVEFCQIQKTWQSNPLNISVVGLILMMIMLFWMLTSIITFIMFFDHPTLKWDDFFSEIFLSGNHTLFVFMGCLFGGLIALFTFCISVITIPLLMDRQINFMTAIYTSVMAVKNNKKELMLWAYLITLLVCFSFFTYFIGLVIVMPLISHATWHAYRSLVEPSE